MYDRDVDGQDSLDYVFIRSPFWGFLDEPLHHVVLVVVQQRAGSQETNIAHRIRSSTRVEGCLALLVHSVKVRDCVLHV